MNWPSIIFELQAAGQTQADIARSCECSQPTISDIARGTIKEPKHALGESLLALHRVIVGRPKAEATA